MNIISGKFRRRQLVYPKDRQFRPTKAIVREAVFSILGGSAEAMSVLDLCSGSGAIGFEAESRGAEHVVCVDNDITYLKKNKINLNSSVTIVRLDIISYLKRLTTSFDVIYLDPVWSDHKVYEMSLSLILERQLLNSNGVLFIEHDASFQYLFDDNVFKLKQYKYGNSELSVLRYSLKN